MDHPGEWGQQSLVSSTSELKEACAARRERSRRRERAARSRWKHSSSTLECVARRPLSARRCAPRARRDGGKDSHQHRARAHRRKEALQARQERRPHAAHRLVQLEGRPRPLGALGGGRRSARRSRPQAQGRRRARKGRRALEPAQRPRRDRLPARRRHRPHPGRGPRGSARGRERGKGCRRRGAWRFGDPSAVSRPGHLRAAADPITRRSHRSANATRP